MNVAYINNDKSRISVDKGLAKIFVFCLSLRMLTAFGLLTDILGAQAEYFDFVIHCLGVGLYLISHRGIIKYQYITDSDKLFRFFIRMVGIFVVISAIMTILVYAEYGNLNGASPFVASTKLSLDFLQYIFMFIYCRIVFKLLTIKEIERILHYEIVFLLILGYMQILMALGGGIAFIYNPIKKIINLSHISFSRGVCLTLIEPSHAAMLISIIVVPFYLSRILYHAKVLSGDFIEFLLWIPVIVMTQSTTTYLMFFAEMFIGMLWFIGRKRTNVFIKLAAVFTGIVMFAILIKPTIVDELFGINFSYLLSEKVVDTANQSTNSRMSVLYANLKIFMQFPFIGCGNGLQGYFYKDYSYLLNGKLVDASVRALFSSGANTIANGVLFFPALLSGYGIVGSGLFCCFIVKCIKVIKRNKEKYEFLYYYYLLALIGITIAGFKSEFVGIYYIWFIFSIPLVNPAPNK